MHWIQISADRKSIEACRNI